MRLRARFVTLGAVVIILCVAVPARACECLGSSVCRIAELSDAVFTGTAVDIREESKDYPSTALKGRTVTLRQRVTRFQIQKVVRGLSPNQKIAEVRTGLTDGECGVSFKAGETYLVYAHRSESIGLSTNICSRTRPLTEAVDDIPLIESFLAGKTLTAILGTVNVWGSGRPDGLDRSAAEGMEVEVKGNKQSFKATVDSRGMFRVWNVPADTYTTRLVLSQSYMDFIGRNVPVSKVSIGPGACSADVYAILPVAGRVQGRIVNRDGKLAPAGTKVSLFDAKPNSHKPSVISSRTDANGSFRFDGLVPGKYIIHVGDVFYGMDLSKDTTIDLWSTWGTGVEIQMGK